MRVGLTYWRQHDKPAPGLSTSSVIVVGMACAFSIGVLAGGALGGRVGRWRLASVRSAPDAGMTRTTRITDWGAWPYWAYTEMGVF